MEDLIVPKASRLDRIQASHEKSLHAMLTALSIVPVLVIGVLNFWIDSVGTKHGWFADNASGMHLVAGIACILIGFVSFAASAILIAECSGNTEFLEERVGRKNRFWRRHGIGRSFHTYGRSLERAGIATADEYCTNNILINNMRKELNYLTQQPSDDQHVQSAIPLAKKELRRAEDKQNSWQKAMQQLEKDKAKHSIDQTREQERLAVAKAQQQIAARIHARAEVTKALEE